MASDLSRLESMARGYFVLASIAAAAKIPALVEAYVDNGAWLLEKVATAGRQRRWYPRSPTV